MKKLLLTLFSGLSLSACTIVPDPIKVDEQVNLVPFEQIMNNPVQELGLGENARWGGKIVGVTNLEEVSEIEVVYFPAKSTGKPTLSEPSAGRFKAVVEGFIDPLVFEQDRLITFVGQVGQPVAGIIGEQKYTYPTLKADGYYMWRDTTEVEVDSFAFQPMIWFGGNRRAIWDPWYGPSRWHQRQRYRARSINSQAQGGSLRNNSNSTPSSKPAKPNVSEVRSSRSPEPKTQLR